METFRYHALDANRQLVVDELQAESVSRAIADLEARGLSVLSITVASAELPPRPAATESAVGAEQAALQQHMGRVIEQGRAIAPALRAYAEEMPSGRRRRQLTTVLTILERGDAAEATTALRALPAFWIPLLGAATASQDPGRVLSEFLREAQRADDLRRQWWLTLAYPLFVAAIAAVVLTAISFILIPVFRDIFIGFDLPLPQPTRFLLTLAEWITSGRIIIYGLLILAGGYLLLQMGRLFPQPTRSWLDDRFGTPLRRTTALARFSQFLADLLEADLNVPSALRVAGFVTESPRIRRAAWRLAKDVESQSASECDSHRRFLTATILHALTANVSRGGRIRLLREISLGYEERVRTRLSWTQGIIEPVAVGVIGLVVLGTTVALFMPLIMLIQGLAGG